MKLLLLVLTLNIITISQSQDYSKCPGVLKTTLSKVKKRSQSRFLQTVNMVGVGGPSVTPMFAAVVEWSVT